MSLEPLITAPLPIQLHAFAALAALVLGGLQLLRPKGSEVHRAAGYVWVALMLLIAVSGLFIHEIRMIGPFSPVHLLSLIILVTVPLAVYRARQGNIEGHRRAMLNIYWIALIGAGIFTMLPGRIMGQVLFGSQ
jgi:uncharacterized membrane protein